jgi:hypothetical protein
MTRSLRSPFSNNKDSVLDRLIYLKTKALLNSSIPYLTKANLIFDSVKALLNTSLKSP